MAKFSERWQRGRTCPTGFVLERRGHGPRYTTALDVGTKPEALPELALFERDRDAYMTRIADGASRVRDRFIRPGRQAGPGHVAARRENGRRPPRAIGRVSVLSVKERPRDAEATEGLPAGLSDGEV